VTRPGCKAEDRRCNLAARVLRARLILWELERKLEKLDGARYSNIAEAGAIVCTGLGKASDPIKLSAAKAFLNLLEAE